MDWNFDRMNQTIAGTEQTRFMDASIGRTITGERVSKPDIRVAFVLSPQFTLLPFAGFIDAMRHSADDGDKSRQIFCQWECIGATMAPVRASCGVEILPWRTYGSVADYDYIIVVGGLLSSLDNHHPETLEFLRHGYKASVSIIGLCTGSFVMAAAGLMNGRKCAVHIHHRQQLLDRFPEVRPVINEMYIFDHGLITCPGGTAAIDLAVDILTQHCGRSRGMKGLAALVVDEHRAAHDVGRLPFDDLSECGDWRVEAAVKLMRQNLGAPETIETLAVTIGTTVRQLDRAFARHAKSSPQRVWRDMRLQHARWRLVNTTRSITEIAHECGFADSAHFSRWFKRDFGEAPRTYRESRRAEVRT